MNDSRRNNKSNPLHGWADRARQMLEIRGLTYDQIAPALNVSTRSAVGHYLSCRRQLSAEQAVSLADRLGCRVGWMLTGEMPVEPLEEACVGRPTSAELIKKLESLPEPVLLSLAALIDTMSYASSSQISSRKRKNRGKG